MRSISITLLAASMAKTTLAHMIMAQPVPYGEPNSSPLATGGSDFPCKLNGGSGTLTVKTMNEFKVGSNQTLSFTGSAVHGGGSCQLSVTLDKAPTKDSVFKVIHSIEGGCPGVSGAGDNFSFEIPDSLPNGVMSFAWTWFNKVGNREMYMNCAPITVTGGASNNKAFDALPNMAVANIGTNSCKTPESSDYTFDEPGASIQKIGNGPFAKLCGGAASGNGNGNGNAQNSVAAPSQTPNNGLYSQAPVSSVVPASSAVPTVVSSILPSASPYPVITSTIHTLITVTAGSSPSTTALANTTYTPPTPTLANPSPVTPSPTAVVPGSGSGPASCSPDGAIICNGAAQFGLCNHGRVVFQAVAPGTTCSNGRVARRGWGNRFRRGVVVV